MTPSIPFGATPEHVLVTGATGFIGKLLVHALVEHGHHVIVLTRNRDKAARQFDKAVTSIEDLNDLPTTQHIDVIINLAGARILGWRWTAARKQVLRQSRIGTTQNIVNWIARADHKPRLFLSASAIGYYGVQARKDTAALIEDSEPQAIFMSRLCQEWEMAAHPAAQHGVKVMCMRFGLVLGDEGALPMMLLPIRLGLGGRLGDGKQSLSWIHIHDLLRAIAHLWNIPHGGQAEIDTYNFTAPQYVTQEVFSQTAAKVLHRPCIFPTPAISMKLLLGEQADLLLEGQRVSAAKLQASGFEFSFPDLQSALENIIHKNHIG
ncbi:TIGR01777 family oxidoreductase [Herminiimonas aquatilis]|uniref:TIGR01777 family oxidoreductase n=1 Tax=Herminiimonas aquatilis TaxID=345342 RepID=A0ABW2J372_9BURK